MFRISHQKLQKVLCEGLESLESYDEKNRRHPWNYQRRFPKRRKYLEDEYVCFAANLEFEAAQNVKERLDILEDYQARNTVVNPNILMM